MNTPNSIVKNITVIGISRTLTSILAFILLIYVTRYLGEADFGKYSFAVSFSTLFIIFADLGISQYIVREIARNKELTSIYLTNISLVKIILSFIAFWFISITINLMEYPQSTVIVVYLFGIYTILNSHTQTLTSIFQAFEKMEYTAIVLLIQKIALLSLTYYLFSRGYGILELAYSYIVTEIVGIIISTSIIIIRIEKPKFTIDFDLCKRLIIESIPFGLNALFAMLFFKIDTIMLSYFKGDIEVGIYNAAYNPLLALSILISTVIVSAIYPVMSRTFTSSKDSLERITLLSSKYMLIIGFPIAIGCFVLADKLIALFYGDKFSASILAFQILSLFIPIRLVSHITGTLLSSIDKQNFRAFSVCIGSIINITLNAYLIPYLGYIGASIATVLSEIFLYYAYIYYINKHYKKVELYRYMAKPLIASLIMGGGVFYFREINLFLLIIFAGLIYFVILLSLKPFTTKEVKNIKNIYQRD